jgi:hypothetical protein
MQQSITTLLATATLLAAIFTLVFCLAYSSTLKIWGGGDIFFRNVGWLSLDYATLYPISQNSSEPPMTISNATRIRNDQWNPFYRMVIKNFGQKYWVLILCPSSAILETRKHNVSETGSVSILRWWGRHPLCSVPYKELTLITHHSPHSSNELGLGIT